MGGNLTREALPGTGSGLCPGRAAKFLAALFLLIPPAFAAGIIPDDVAVIAFARPAGSQFQLLLRVPMVAFGDIRFPMRGAENYLDLAQVDAMLPSVAKYWLAPALDVYENNTLLPKALVVQTRLALDSDPSFASYDSALAHLQGPRVDPNANVFWRQTWLDVLFEFPIQSDRSDFAVRFKLAHLGARVVTDLKFLAPDGTIRSFDYPGDPGVIRLDPRWYESAFQFVQWGVFHLLNESDYLLFVFCLVFPIRRLEASVPVAVAFVSASSATLIGSASGLAPGGLWFQPMIETAVALSILYLALANIGNWIAPERRPLMALGFGLLFGFDFWFGLGAKLQFAGSHALVSTLAYNAGVALAFFASLGVLIPVLQLLARITRFAPFERFVPSVLAAHTAWHWMTERWGRLSLFRLRWPVIDAALLADAMRWLMILVLLLGGARIVAGIIRSRSERRSRVA